MFKKIMKFLMGEPVGYVSETDEFLTELRQRYPKPSASQQAEIKNHDAIAAARDGIPTSEKDSKVWRDF